MEKFKRLTVHTRDFKMQTSRGCFIFSNGSLDKHFLQEIKIKKPQKYTQNSSNGGKSVSLYDTVDRDVLKVCDTGNLKHIFHL